MALERKIILSLDIGSSMIRAGVGAIQKNGNLKILGIIERQSDCIRKEQVVNQQQFEKVVKSVISEAELQCGAEVTDIVTGIGGAEINCVINTGVAGIGDADSVISTSDIKRAMESASSVAIRDDYFVLHSFALDFSVDGNKSIKNPDGMTGNRLECRALVITAPLNSRNNLNNCLCANGFSNSRFLLKPYSDSEVVLSEEEKKEGIILLNLGGGSSSMVVYKNGDLVFAAGIDIGGNNITSDVAVFLDQPLSYAEQVKREFGCCYAPLIDPKETLNITKTQRFLAPKLKKAELVGVIQKRMTEIFTQLNQLLQQNGIEKDSYGSVVLTGGGALMSGAVNLAKDIFCKDVKIGFPEPLPGLDRNYISPQYTTLLGQLKLYNKKYAARSKVSKFTLKNKRFLKIFVDFWRTIF